LGNLIADAQRWAGKADVAAVNNGGIRQDLPSGQVTWGALYAVQPFANPLRRLTVPGRALRAYLATLVARDGAPTAHVSGVRLRFDHGRGGAPHLASARLAGGAELRDDARYTIVLNDFMATGTEGRILTEAATADETLASDDLDALIAYLSSRPQPVAAPNDTRITVSRPCARGTPMPPVRWRGVSEPSPTAAASRCRPTRRSTPAPLSASSPRATA